MSTMTRFGVRRENMTKLLKELREYVQDRTTPNQPLTRPSNRELKDTMMAAHTRFRELKNREVVGHETRRFAQRNTIALGRKIMWLDEKMAKGQLKESLREVEARKLNSNVRKDVASTKVKVKAVHSTPKQAQGATLTGPRGGQFTLVNGRKVYVKR